MYKILKTDGRAKRAEFTTVHGTVQTLSRNYLLCYT